MRSLDPTEVQCTFVGLKSPEILFGLASKDLAYQLLLAGDSGYISAAYENLSRAYSRIDLLGLFSHRRSG